MITKGPASPLYRDTRELRRHIKWKETPRRDVLTSLKHLVTSLENGHELIESFSTFNLDSVSIGWPPPYAGSLATQFDQAQSSVTTIDAASLALVSAALALSVLCKGSTAVNSGRSLHGKLYEACQKAFLISATDMGEQPIEIIVCKGRVRSLCDVLKELLFSSASMAPQCAVSYSPRSSQRGSKMCFSIALRSARLSSRSIK